jgi:hypothetical protein
MALGTDVDLGAFKMSTFKRKKFCRGREKNFKARVLVSVMKE